MKSLRITTALAGGALAALLGCSQGSEPPSAPEPAAAPEPVPAPPPPAAAAPSPTPQTTAAPGSTALLPIPAGLVGDPSRGDQQYQIFCATCHGPQGDGDGPLAESLNPKPAKHSDGNYMNSLPDEHLFTVIKMGGTAVGKSPLMAPWGGTLKDPQIVDAIAFIRTLATPPYQP